MRTLMLALAMIFTANFATADITWKVDRLSTGAVMVMQGDQGTLTHVKRGDAQGLHVFEVFDGNGPTATFIGSYSVNERGEVIQTVAVDGAVTRFAPHRCSRTVGTCRFVMTHADGFVEPRTRVTEQTKHGLAYKEYGLNGLIAEGALKLDTMGGAISSWKRTAGEAWKVKSKRVALAMN